MRLTQDEQSAIRTAATEAVGADDHKKGGDIDLLVRPSHDATDQPFSRKIRMLTRLERLLGERKIDLVIEAVSDTRPIVGIAHATGIQLK